MKQERYSMIEVVAHVKNDQEYVQYLFAAATIVTAFISIIYTAKSYLNQKKHNINAIKPLINVTFVEDEKRLSLAVQNLGLGPAVIQRLKYWDRSKDTYYESMHNYLNKKIMEKEVKSYNLRTMNAGTPISPGNVQLLLTLQKDNLSQESFGTEKKKIVELIQNLQLDISYKDLYGIEYNYSCNLASLISEETN